MLMQTIDAAFFLQTLNSYYLDCDVHLNKPSTILIRAGMFTHLTIRFN